MTTIYRVLARKTGSVQPIATFWTEEVLYCGTDRLEARVAYHTSTPEDYGGTPGNRCRETVIFRRRDHDQDDCQAST